MVAAADGDATRAVERWEQAAELKSENSFVYVQAARARLLHLGLHVDPDLRLSGLDAARLRSWLDRACTVSPRYEEAWETLALLEARAAAR